MVGCSVPGCSSRSEKGFLLKQLPTDPIRRAMWIERLPQRDWSLQYLRICEVHFTSDQFETLRVDGKKKLKTCALPTLFLVKDKSKAHKRKSKENPPTKEQIKEAQNIEMLEMIPHLADECLNKSCVKTDKESDIYAQGHQNFAQRLENSICELVTHNESQKDLQASMGNASISTSYMGSSEIIHLKNMDVKNNTDLSKTAIINLLLETTFGNESSNSGVKDIDHLNREDHSTIDVDKLIMENEAYRLKNKKLEEDIVQILLIRKANEEQLQSRIEELEEKLVVADKYLRRVQQTQQEEINKMKERKHLVSKGLNVNHVFNEDQLKYLSKKETTRFFWSNETLNTAVQLKLILGHKKFKELLARNYPLPSVRTVSRRLERFKVAHFQKDVIQFLKDNLYTVTVNENITDDMDIDLDCGAIHHNNTELNEINIPQINERVPTVPSFSSMSHNQMLIETPSSQLHQKPALNNIRLPGLNFHFMHQEHQLNMSKHNELPKQCHGLNTNLNMNSFDSTLTN